MAHIPTLDVSALLDRADPQTDAAILSACQSIGFLSITGTGVPARITDEMRAAVIDIFAASPEDKWEQAVTRENYRGYIPLGLFAPNDKSGRADFYEGYKLHAESAPDPDCALYGPNIWPRHAPQTRAAILAYWAEMDRVALLLLASLARAIGLPEAALTEPFRHPLTNMTLLHYPPQNAQHRGYGIHPHKDTDALTIISPDPVGGLEVRTKDGWITPDCPPGGFVVNIGDMLELWSGGRLISTPHRVINRSGRERYSFPYFAVPRHNVTVAPLLAPLPGFDRPPVPCGLWSAEIWRTNWPDETATPATPELGTLTD